MLLIYIIALNLASAASATEGPCEEGMSTPAIRYLRMVRAGLNDGTVQLKDFKWAMEQNQPTLPISDARDVTNLARVQKLRAQIPHITAAQWKRLQDQSTAVINEIVANQGKVEEAKEATKFIYSFIGKFNLTEDEDFHDQFISSNNEVFLFSHQFPDSFIYNVTKKTKVKIPNHFVVASSEMDFYETSNGDVLLAQVTQDQVLSVTNARTGVELFALEENKFERRIKPLMFEDVNGVLNVIVGESSGTVINWDVAKATHLVQYIPGKGARRIPKFSPSYKEVRRMSDGRLYGTRWYSAIGEFTYEMYDLSTGSKVIDVHAAPHELSIKEIDAVYDGEFKLVATTFEGKQFIWDDSKKEFKPTRVSGNTSLIGEELFSVDVDTASSGNTLKLEITHVGSGKTESVPLPLSNSANLTSADLLLRFIASPFGPLAYTWDKNRKSQEHTLVLYNLKTKKFVPVPSPNVTHAFEIFHKDGRLYIVMEVNQQSYKLYQLYGPDGSSL